MNKLYRVYTENLPGLETLVAMRFENVTILTGKGYYKGAEEKCAAVIELVLPEHSMKRVIHLAGVIKDVLHQERVLITVCDIESVVV